MANESIRLDSLEISYHNAWQIKRQALLSVKNNDFFVKANMLPSILGANLMMKVLAIALVIFLGYVDLQAIILKFSISSTDEYHTNLAKYNEERKAQTEKQMRWQAEREKKEFEQKTGAEDRQHAQQKFDTDLEDINQLIEREYQLVIINKTLKEKGYKDAAVRTSELRKNYTRMKGDSYQGGGIFRMTRPMQAVVEDVKKVSTPENLAKNLFEWVVDNIEYDRNHSKEFYRDAAATYNNKRGVCGELSVLLMAFFKTENISCSFCEVTQDDTGKELIHACVALTGIDGHIQLVDAAYKSFQISHEQYRIITDNELVNNFKKWNR